MGVAGDVYQGRVVITALCAPSPIKLGHKASVGRWFSTYADVQAAVSVSLHMMNDCFKTRHSEDCLRWMLCCKTDLLPRINTHEGNLPPDLACLSAGP